MNVSSEQSKSKKGNIFAVLADSDSESEIAVKEEQTLQKVREWKEDGKRPVRFRRPEPEIHFMADEEPTPAPPAQAPVATPPLISEFPSLLSRGQQQTNPAMAWAEKVKQSLEKAEAARKPSAPYQPSEDFIASLGKLSFFRGGSRSARTTEG